MSQVWVIKSLEPPGHQPDSATGPRRSAHFFPGRDRPLAFFSLTFQPSTRCECECGGKKIVSPPPTLKYRSVCISSWHMARELDALVVVIMIELRQQHHRVRPLYRLRVWLLCSTAAARRPPCATFFKSNGLSAPDRRSHGHQLPKNEVSSSRHLRHRPGRFCPRYRVQRWNCRQCLSLTDFHFWN